MTTQPIDESGMKFGPYPEGHCFHIEKSTTYQKVQQGVQMAEFLLLRPKDVQPATVWIVEAKSSTPHPQTQPDFDTFIDGVREKLTNALALGLASCLHRHPTAAAELPAAFGTLDLSTARFRLVLVIKGHQEAWLPPLQDALAGALRATAKTWALPANAVTVINDGLARSYGLIA